MIKIRLDLIKLERLLFVCGCVKFSAKMEKYTNQTCDTCGKVYSRRASLRRHIWDRHLGVLLQCGSCDYSTTRKADMTRHKRSRHAAGANVTATVPISHASTEVGCNSSTLSMAEVPAVVEVVSSAEPVLASVETNATLDTFSIEGPVMVNAAASDSIPVVSTQSQVVQSTVETSTVMNSVPTETPAVTCDLLTAALTESMISESSVLNTKGTVPCTIATQAVSSEILTTVVRSQQEDLDIFGDIFINTPVYFQPTPINGYSPDSPVRVDTVSQAPRTIPLSPPRTPPRDPRGRYRLRDFVVGHRPFRPVRLPAEQRLPGASVYRFVEETVTTPDGCSYNLRYQELEMEPRREVYSPSVSDVSSPGTPLQDEHIN